MTDMRKTITSLLFCLVTLVAVNAQKFGYVNVTLLLESLPEVQVADKELATLQEQLLTDGQAQVAAFEKAYLAYMEQVNNGDLSKVQMAEMEQELTQEQQAIASLEQEVQNKIMVKREELLKPILERVDVAIKAVGKEGGFTFIFDSSLQGAMLYAPEGDDIVELVKAKL